MKNRTAAQLTLFILMATLIVAPISTPYAEEDPVVAIVDGDPIHRSVIETFHENLPAQYQGHPLEKIFPELLEQVISFKLIANEARRNNYSNSDKMKRRLAMLEDQLIRQEYLKETLASSISEHSLRKRYKDTVGSMPPKDEVSARHILVESEEQAREIIGELKGGADFIQLAMTRSIGPSKDNGGNLGYFTREAMVPEFSAAAFELGVGEITQSPVKTPYGWHVIKVEDRREAQTPSFEELRGTLQAQVSQEVVTKLVEDLRSNAEVQKFDLNGEPQAN